MFHGRPATFFPNQAASAQASAASGANPNAAVPTSTAAAANSAAPAAPAAATGQLTTVTTDVYRLTFDSNGGSLVGADLLKYPTDSRDASSAPITLLQNNAKQVYVAQTGLLGEGQPNHLTPMTLTTPNPVLSDGQNSVQVRYESPDQGGVKLVKTYTITRGSYAITVQDEVVNSGGQAVSPQLYQQFARDSSEESGSYFYSTFTGPAVYSDEGKYQKITFKDIDKGKVDFQKTAPDGYVAMAQHYFSSAWIPEAGTARENFVRKIGNNLYSAGQIFNLGQIDPGTSKTISSTLFVGPQDEKLMNTVAPNLDLVKDYGLFTILARPMYWLLTFLHSFLANWGWSIVLLVVLLKIAFYWLNHKAYASMAKMKAVNPKVQALRERYKDDPQRMQQETMRIYREEKVNPLGGCLPMLVQIPVFMALYWVLLSSVEMRGAPWIMWVKDLSSPDPLFILPVLMTLTSLAQVWLNPTPPDPMQAKMMWFMPLAFSVMFFFFPSGLVLYWLTNNILSIAQQWNINRVLGTNKK